MLLRNKHFSATIALLLLLISSCGTQQAEQKKEEEPSMTISSGLGAKFSPDETKLAFYSTEGQPQGRGNIYTANLDGTDLVKISVNDTVGMHTEPVWSNDGRKIAYTNFHNDGAKLKVLDVATKEVADLPMVEGGYNMFSAWGNEEGQYYFFHWPNGGFTPDAYFFDGSEVQRMTSDGQSTRPWISSENKVYFAKVIDEAKRDYAIHLYDVESGTSEEVSGLDEFFLWKGDYFTGQINRNDSTILFQGNINSSERIELGGVAAKSVMFQTRTKDGGKVLFNTSWEDGANIHILELESQKLNKLTFTN